MTDDINTTSKNENLIEENSGTLMKCCAKPCAVYVCCICLSVFHRSCAEKANELKVFNGNKVVCCKSEVEFQNQVFEENAKIQQLDIEITYLKELLNEVRDKNNVLHSNNHLLLDKIQNMHVNKAVPTTPTDGTFINTRQTPWLTEVERECNGSDTNESLIWNRSSKVPVVDAPLPSTSKEKSQKSQK
ncbi:hypothetical protein JTB14_028196 [Gonioctena quinquepunctata]|nr:hypothetical protein JTB14_028196 [Gonioctena quinquepunctata]